MEESIIKNRKKNQSECIYIRNRDEWIDKIHNKEKRPKHVRNTNYLMHYNRSCSTRCVWHIPIKIYGLDDFLTFSSKHYMHIQDKLN